MRSPMELVADTSIERAVLDGWGLALDDLVYVPEGGGAYHWAATARGRRWFVTCDDLDTKPWLGADRDAVFAGLVAAYRTAMDLRAGGLGFVVAPVASDAGAAAVRLDDRHSVSVFAYIDGVPGRWGTPAPRARTALVSLLVELHGATAPPHVPTRGHLDVPGRVLFDEARRDLDSRWDGGPFGEPARRALARHVDAVVAALHRLEVVAGETSRLGRDVVTHGEPHPGNLIDAAGEIVLVDWDTVALAPAERDLWMVADDDVVAAYRSHTGIELDRALLDAYRSRWALSDIVAYTTLLRGEHDHGADAERAWAGLHSLLDGDEPQPFVVG